MRLLSALTVGLSLAFTAITVHAETLVLGSVNSDVRKYIERLTPLARYLEEALADDGITDVEIAVLPDSETMALALRTGEVDFYFDSPLVAGRVARLADAEPFLQRWNNGVGSYHSIIVVPADSTIVTLEDLRGAIIGFEGRDSTSGFMLPAAMIRGHGVPLRELVDTEQPAPESEAGFVFTGDDHHTVIWLARGHIDAGATDPEGYAWLEEAQPGQYRVLDRSADVPRQVVVRRGDMDPQMVQHVADILRSMETTELGRDVMMQFNGTTRFDDFPDGVDATFEPIYELLDQLDSMDVI